VSAITPEPGSASNFFDRNSEERVEILEGLIREGDIAVLAGNYGKGKSPVIADLTIHLINGRDWCGRKVSQRPIVAFDFETPATDYKRTIRLISDHRRVQAPRVPDDLAIYLERDAPDEPATKQLLDALAKPGSKPRMDLIESALEHKPNAVVFIDPVAMIFSTLKQADILSLYRDFRNVLHRFRHAAIVCTFNLRKLDRKNGRANLLSDPREWLEEVSGSLDILNRCDARLGIETHNDDVRVINGIVRGREMHPLLIRPVRNGNDQLTGFEQVTPDQLDLLSALSVTMKGHWDKLPHEFRFEDAADKVVPRSSLYRLIEKAKPLGALKRGEDGVFIKLTGIRELG
jgi:hypothetical protein